MSDLLDDAEPFDVLLEEVLRDPRAALAARASRARFWRHAAVAAVVLLGVGVVVVTSLWRRTADSPRYAVSPQGKDDVVPKDREEFSRLLRIATAIRFTRKEVIGATQTQTADSLDFDVWPETVTADATVSWFENLRSALLEAKSTPDWKGIDTCLLAEVLLPEGKRIQCFVNLGKEGGEATNTRFGLGGRDLQPLVPNEALQKLLTSVNDELELQHRLRRGQVFSVTELAQLPATSERVDCPAFAGLAQQLSRFAALRDLRLRSGDDPKAVDDAYLAQLTGLPLTTLDLPAFAITDAGIAKLAALTQLTTLILRGADYDFTGSGFATLRDLPLRELTLHECHGIHTEGYAAMTKLPRLATLRLSRSGLRADGAFYPTLQSFPSLTELALRGENIRDTDMPHLLRTRLRKLVLVDADVTGAGLETLKELPSLRELQLAGVALKDSDVEHLGHLGGLQRLEIHGGSGSIGMFGGKVSNGTLTADAARQLTEALPKCTVVYDPASRWFNTLMALPMLRD